MANISFKWENKDKKKECYHIESIIFKNFYMNLSTVAKRLRNLRSLGINGQSLTDVIGHWFCSMLGRNWCQHGLCRLWIYILFILWMLMNCVTEVIIEMGVFYDLRPIIDVDFGSCFIETDLNGYANSVTQPPCWCLFKFGTLRPNLYVKLDLVLV